MFQIPYSRHSFSRACNALAARSEPVVAQTSSSTRIPRRPWCCRFAIWAESQALVVICTSGRASGLPNTAERSTVKPGPDVQSTVTVEGPSNMPRRVCSNSLTNPTRNAVSDVLSSPSESRERCRWRRTTAGSSPNTPARSPSVGGDRWRWTSSTRSVATARTDSSTPLRSRRSTWASIPMSRLWRASRLVSGSPEPGSRGLSRSRPPGARRTTGIPNAVGERPVFAFGVGDGDEPAGPVVAGLAPQHRLHRRRLAVARLPQHEHVRVRHHDPAAEVPAVQLERVEAPRRTAVGDVHPDVRGGQPGEGVAAVERVQRRQMCRGGPMPGHP